MRAMLRTTWARVLPALLLWTVATAHAETPSERRTELLKQGLAAFDRGAALARSHPDDSTAAFHEAIGDFETLVAGGLQNGKLFYNLGNAYLQVGQVGKAIINYRRAERLLGHDPQLAANLAYARSLCRSPISSSGSEQLLRTVFFWHYDTSLRARYIVAIGAYILFWVVLAMRRMTRTPATALLTLSLLVLWLGAGVSAGIEWRQRVAQRPGVLMTADVVVRKGNGDAYEPQFKEALGEGVEFILREERPGWLKIQLPDGNTGWIRNDQAELL